MFAPDATGLIHYEDILVDHPMLLGPHRITRDEIKAFARAYDPQIIHLDEEAAKNSIVGGLCASGFHTCCLMMRLLCDHYLNRSASLGAPGVEDVKWLKPVRPDDLLTVRIKATDKRVMASRPSVGMARAEYDVLNQNGNVLMSSVCQQMLRVRNPGPAQAGNSPKPPRAGDAEPRNLWDMPDAPRPSETSIYFEDRIVGEIADLGTATFPKDEVIAFARQFDPQPFHLDEASGKASLFGGLAASGWHTAAHFIRLIVASRQAQEAAIRAKGLPVASYGPSPGFKNLRWLKPVMAGDTLEFRVLTSNKRELKSRPTRGMVESFAQARNQRGEIVYEYTGFILAERRVPGAA